MAGGRVDGRRVGARVPVDEGQAGVIFPVDEQGARSSTATGRAVVADALRVLDPTAAARAAAAGPWRTAYLEHVVALTAAGARTADGSVAAARAGLDSAHRRMQFGRDGAHRPLAEVIGKPTGSDLGTARVRGRGARAGQVEVPYRGQLLRGDALRRQLDAWTAVGSMEPSCGQAIGAVLDSPDWLDLSDRAVAVLGAGSEMGPLPALLGWGASVLAVDVPVPRVWERVLAAARAGCGTLHVPLRPGGGGGPGGGADAGGADAAGADLAGTAGADLLTQTPELARWVADTATDLPLTVGSYAYADGARHLQVALAGDALVVDVLRRRADVSYAELATPTDTFVVPAEVVADAQGRLAARRWRARVPAAARRASRGALFVEHYPSTFPGPDGQQLGVADALVPQQGPNYALAKRVQRWRALVAQADGVLVSANVAPATRTRSVLKNRVLAAAYAGAHRFGVEVFEPATSRALLAALLVHDLRAGRPAPALPDDLLVQGAAHGGLWRIGYTPRSVLGLAAVIGAPRALRRR